MEHGADTTAIAQYSDNEDDEEITTSRSRRKKGLNLVQVAQKKFRMYQKEYADDPKVAQKYKEVEEFLLSVPKNQQVGKKYVSSTDRNKKIFDALRDEDDEDEEDLLFQQVRGVMVIDLSFKNSLETTTKNCVKGVL